MTVDRDNRIDTLLFRIRSFSITFCSPFVNFIKNRCDTSNLDRTVSTTASKSSSSSTVLVEKMRSIVLTTLSIFLGLFFVFIGSLKVTHAINREMHREIRRNFIQYAKVIPFSQQFAWLKLTPRAYRLAIGWNEIVSGSMLVLLPNWLFVKNLANIALFASNALFFYTHVKLGDKFERIAPSIVFGLMLLCRLIVYLQVQAREDSEKRRIVRELRKKRLAEVNQSMPEVQHQSSSEPDEDHEAEEDDDDEDPLDQLDDDQFERLLKLRRKKLKAKLMRKRLNKIEPDLLTTRDAGTEPITVDDPETKKNE